MQRNTRLRTRAYFVTLRAWKRGSLFGRVANGKMRPNPLGHEVAACWSRLPENFTNVVLDTFVVMPDHLHGILLVTDRGPGDSAPLPSILDSFRETSNGRIECAIWGEKARKHVIRDSDELTRIRHYIRENPARWPQDPRNLPPFSRC